MLDGLEEVSSGEIGNREKNIKKNIFVAPTSNESMISRHESRSGEIARGISYNVVNYTNRRHCRRLPPRKIIQLISRIVRVFLSSLARRAFYSKSNLARVARNDTDRRDVLTHPGVNEINFDAHSRADGRLRC